MAAENRAEVSIDPCQIIKPATDKRPIGCLKPGGTEKASVLGHSADCVSRIKNALDKGNGLGRWSQDLPSSGRAGRRNHPKPGPDESGTG